MTIRILGAFGLISIHAPTPLQGWNTGTYTFGGEVHLSTGEIVNFEAPRSEGSGERENSISEWREAEAEYGEIYYLPLDISSPTFPGRNHELVIANGVLEWVHFDQMIVKRWGVRDVESGRFADSQSLESRVASIAEPWIGFTNQAVASYLELRGQHRSSKILVPVLQVQVAGSTAAPVVGLTSLFLAFLLCHAMHGAEAHTNQEASEAWIVIPPKNRNSALGRQTAICISRIGAIVFGVSLMLPLLSTMLAGSLGSGLAVAWATTCLAGGNLVVTGFSVGSFLRFLKEARLFPFPRASLESAAG